LSFWLPAAYPWIKSLHIVSMVAWMAGLLYLPRLYAYHSLAPAGSDRSETFKVMERRLQRGIMTPAMIATWGFGLVLAGTPGVVDWRMGWIWTKLTFVVGLTIFHVVLARCAGPLPRIAIGIRHGYSASSTNCRRLHSSPSSSSRWLSHFNPDAMRFLTRKDLAIPF